MAIFLFALATLFAFQLVQLVYVVSQAVVGHLIGGTVEAISVGTGPVLWSRLHRGVEWRISWIPTGGYTKFYGMDEAEGEQDIQSESHDHLHGHLPFRELPFFGRLLLLVIGPASSIAIGLGLMAMPIALSAPQIVVGAQSVAPIDPRAVPDLGISNNVTTLRGQEQLYRDSFVEFWKRLLTFEPMKGWGTFVGWLMTCSAAATVSAPAWLTCFGVVCFGLGVLNLVPIPPLNGAHIVFQLLSAVFGRRIDKLVTSLTMIGILFVLIVMVSLLVIDAKWCIAKFSVS